MALIHRIQARLPHGRAVLYGKIVDAYLESIDAYRGIQEVDYSLEEKKRWLAWVGFRMQRRRSLETEAREEHKEREILVDEEDLLTWLEEAMALSPRALDVAEPGTAARAFVDYIARRSGLLLPRGEGRYAFTHLSFQEYFAALHLEARITSPRWFEKPQPEEGDGPDNVRAYANYDAWREPLVLLFGLLAGRPEWAEELAELIFGEGFSDLCEDENGHYACKARLLAEVSADPHAGLPGDHRERAWTCSWRWELSQQQRLRDLGALVNHDPVIARTLLSCDVSDEVGIWRSFKNSYRQEGIRRLNMNNIGAFRDLGHLSALSELSVLSASGSSIRDLSPLAMPNKLEFLWLHFTDVKDLRPLSKLSSLRLLGISSTTVSNLTPLARLQNLQYLYLHDTAVGDLSPLADLRKLEALALTRSKVTDLGPLRRVKSLRILMVDHTSIESLKPIESLTGVEVLGLSWASVNDFAPLCGLFNLRILDVSGTQFEDLGLLVGLDNLTDLVLAETQVTNLRPLANLSRLAYLELAGTRVEDISPLARLTSLRRLGLSRTKVTNLEPLAHLDGLDYVDLRNTKIKDVRAISELQDNVEIVGGPETTSTR
jgi:internalin A